MLKKALLWILFVSLLSSCNILLVSGKGKKLTFQIGPRREELSSTPTLALLSLTPTPTPSLIFSVDNINTIPLKDVIQELSYFGGMGGGGPTCGDTVSPAFDLETSPQEEIQIFHPWATYICAVPTGETVRATVDMPSGVRRTYEFTTVVHSGTPQKKGEAFFSFIPDVRVGSVGIYRFLFQGNGWSLNTSIKVVMPSSAQLYLVDNDEYYFEDLAPKLIFYNFHPKEKVRLLAYGWNDTGNMPSWMSGSIKLIGWKEYQVDDQGHLVVPIGKSYGSMSYVAIGDVSGEVHSYTPEGIGIDGNVYCAGAPPLDLVPGGYAFVVVDSLPVWDGQRIIARLKKGDTVRLYDNAFCRDGSWWWNVVCVSTSCAFTNGMVQGSDKQVFSLHPLNNIHSKMDDVVPACAGALPARLHVGTLARVVSGNLTLHYEPSLDSSWDSTLSYGSEVEVWAGPLCVDGVYWWYVHHNQGGEGWIREGDSKNYRIEPVR